VQKLDDLFEKPKIIRVNKFDEDSLEDFEEEMDEAHRTGQDVIPIVVDSYGGSAYGILGMISSIENAELPIATILTSKAMSAGAILFCFGTEGYRFMHPEAWLMIHDVGSYTGGKVEEIKADAKQMDTMNQRMYRRLSKHLGHSQDYIGNLIKENHHVDWFLTAKDAKKHKIANHLYVPKFDVEISLSINFS
jgi:ATP-dependent protease ClpP protease subunit